MTTFAITIGREPGSGGKIIAQQLGKLMNLPVYDKELINMASKDSGLGKEFFEEMDEKVGHSTFGGLFGLRNSLMDEVFSGHYLSHEALFQIQSDVIRKIAASQSVIFVGRCADYVLKNQPNTLNIFISANREDRIERISKYESIDKDKASEWIEKMDKKRAGYYYYFSNKKWGKATSYHLCINSSVLGIDQTAAFIYKFAKSKFKL
ncbi:AAA family ATPase [Geofilum sp. OHC36d9]|uniref:cytidylate kinase-like family protein n=1 Tax=Geofilum sp. OHC36d9 TaxID=3458413 RepID=UPI0040344D7F